MNTYKTPKQEQLLYLKCSEEKAATLGRRYTKGFILNEEDDYIEVCVEGDKENCRFYKDTLEEITMFHQSYFIYLSEKDLLEEFEAIDILKTLHDTFNPQNFEKFKIEVLRQIKLFLDENN
ncbi:hypothetical protein QEW_4681 [Clostridioides difficile CD160]|nr:hypothetical protein QEW_4681 [Clostridioides difficile CD160]